MFVRPWFEKIYNMIVGEVKSTREKGNEYLNVNVTGIPGIAKTVCGLYVMLGLLVEEDKTVVYLDDFSNTHSGRTYVLGPKDSTIVPDTREKGHEIEESDDEYCWGRILIQGSEGHNLLDRLLDQSDLWCVLDAPQTGINIPEKYDCIKVVFSSSHRGSKNTLKEREVLFYMPLWDLKVLHQANQDLKLGMSDSELDDRFMRFGGRARRILAMGFTQAMAFFNDNICSLTFQNAQHVPDPFRLQGAQQPVHSHCA